MLEAKAQIIECEKLKKNIKENIIYKLIVYNKL